jgi:hypothetical protein
MKQRMYFQEGLVVSSQSTSVTPVPAVVVMRTWSYTYVKSRNRNVKYYYYCELPGWNENESARELAVTWSWSAVLNAFPTLSCILLKLNVVGTFIQPCQSRAWNVPRGNVPTLTNSHPRLTRAFKDVCKTIMELSSGSQVTPKMIALIVKVKDRWRLSLTAGSNLLL